ncbi:hypothetical protein [Deinococcus gobiensis]|uniref:Uncharacterized protein n=1 Tax=Deinococcus gobiensis (strain DSM 21396 / JCM 16679 / CGMCC 1.7299 / I-0) TaxID=745776 RepID=H8H3W4_DEIGI|nr:hypothetical protein [Deinococcus gobiensis]AFD28211.1 hypothetical protein DGo_PE0067 [Deinococcus gobiensis I-0]
MAPLKKAIEALDPAPDKKNQLTLALNLLSELSEQKVAQFTEKIESDLRTAGTIENRTVPVTEILANHSEYRAYVKSDAGKIATEVMSAMKNFLAGGSDAILDGIGKLVTTGLEAIIGAGSGSQQEMKSYYIVVQKFGMVRFDIRAWSRQIEANGITSQIETCMAIVAYKSSVDVKKLSFNSFLVLYQDQLAKIGIPEADWDKYLTEAEAMYKKLGGNTGNDQAMEMESAVYRMAPGYLYGTLWEDLSKDVPKPVLSNLLKN